MLTLPISSPADPATASAWYLEGSVAIDGPLQRVSIQTGKFQIGRRPDVNLCLAHPSVSKLHAEFVTLDDALFVRDVGSTNGTFINGKRVVEDTPVGEQDVVQFANFEFVVGRVMLEQSLRTIVSIAEDWQLSLTQFHHLLTARAVVPHFQRIIRFTDGQTVGYEVLARSGLAGMLTPKDMFEAAERANRAAQLSEMCRENGVAVAKRLARPGLIFLNTHPSERPHTGLIESLTQLRSDCPNLEIVLELHEAAVTSPAEIAEFRGVLSELRIGLAYDDFGAGQARLLELAEVAPDFIKFDIGLIRGIHAAPQRQQMVAGLVRIVRELGIQPLAEGIEVEAEAEVCRQVGFTHAQGYLYGKPCAAESLR